MKYVQQLDLIGDRGHKAKVVLKSGISFKCSILSAKTVQR